MMKQDIVLIIGAALLMFAMQKCDGNSYTAVLISGDGTMAIIED